MEFTVRSSAGSGQASNAEGIAKRDMQRQASLGEATGAGASNLCEKRVKMLLLQNSFKCLAYAEARQKKENIVKRQCNFTT